MNFSDSPRYACYDTEYLALSFEKKTGAMAYLGLDSGARKSDVKNTYNLLKPALGARPATLSKKTADIRSSQGDAGFSAKSPKGSFVFAPVAKDDRSFTLSFAVPKGGTLPRSFFTANLQVRTAPPTIWADTTAPVYRDDEAKPRRPGKPFSRTWQLPMTIHFPDYGLLRIEATAPGIDCTEELVPSTEMAGLNLGYRNHGYHTYEVGIHHGVSRLCFRAPKGAKSAKLRFTVLPELAPAAPFVKDPKWNGYRRAWMNNFTLERKTLSMGDNICLNGVGHLCVHTKADMLDLCDPKQNPIFGRIRETLLRTIDTALDRCQADDGEISMEYLSHKKLPGQLITPFSDCCPSNLIAALVALRWDPKRTAKWLPHLLRAADFLLALDSDGDGLVELPFGGTGYNAPWDHPSGRPRIWWDNIAFGHKDAWYNLFCHRAFRMLEPVARAAGHVEEADKLAAWLRRFPAVFRKELYNPKSGLIAGWRDSNGKLHDYGFTFPTAMAVEENVLPKADAKRMLRKLLALMKEAGFGDNRYGIPGNTKPIICDEDTMGWKFMAEWPRYENGGCCGMTAWHFLNALYAVGMAKEADAIYFRMLETFEKEPTHSGLFPGYMESIDWRTKDGNPCGYNYLADNYLFLASGFLHHARRKHPVFAK